MGRGHEKKKALISPQNMADSNGIFAFLGVLEVFGGALSGPNPVGKLANMRNHVGGRRAGPGGMGRM